uniref:Protein SET DOMAIN GROUP 40 n=2 Tax=Rhizophora mucronata TaxID=61149 RepID=A0A2P2JJY2_RHIMU
MVLRVPKSALLTTDALLLKDDSALSYAVNNHANSHLPLSPTQILTACLLYEMGKGKSSLWHPYFLQLPRAYHLLSSFTRFETEALQVDDAIWAAEKATSKAKLEWEEAKPLIQELELKPQLCTFKAWLWASATISSRTMHIEWDEAGCLCPVGDLFNYAAPGEETNGFENAGSIYGSSLQNSDTHLESLTDGGYNEAIAAYCFYARRNYRKGEQVLLSYGTYTNLELLEQYGFLLNENPNDKVFIPLEPRIYSCSSWPKESMYIQEYGKPSYALLSGMRLWATPPHQRRSLGRLAYSGSQLSMENELSVMEWISEHCCRILNNLPTTIEEDNLLLSTIDQAKSLLEPVEMTKLLCSFGREARAFLEENDLQKDKNGVNSVLSSKIRRPMDRWRLAVQWRIKYKGTLIDCISNCNEIINSLSSQNDLTKRTEQYVQST